MSTTKLEHCAIERDADGVAWLTLDVRDTGANTLSSGVLSELDVALDRAVADGRPTGLVFRSAKPGFIAGADVEELGRIQGPEQAVRLIEQGQALNERIAALDLPTVALIRGHCLGGGLELALACRYRVADRDPGTRLGLPEVRLGIHPGFGGTARLPDTIGALAALDLMLSGRTVDGRAAQRLGLVDYALSPWQLDDATRDLIRRDRGPHRPSPWQRALSLAPARRAVRPILRRRVRRRAPPEHYPAPYALLDLWTAHGGSSRARRMAAERDSLVELIQQPAAGNLIRVFLLQNRLKREARNTDVEVPQRVHVVGAGTMGGDIAAWMALHGCRVTLVDERDEAIAATLERATALYDRRLRRPDRTAAALDRLIPDPRGRGVEAADLVIEAIVEDADAKRNLYAALEPRLRDDAVVATNTSSIPLEQLAADLRRPGRLIGLHFFNPVARMPLVEVVAGEHSHPASLDRGQALMAAVDKLPLRVRSGPGFLVNRLLMPYLLRAAAFYEQGKQRELIDAAARQFGMPMGPLELADTVGLDVCLAAADVMAAAQGLEVPPALRERAERGDLGRKTGRGFYAWSGGQAKKARGALGSAGLEELGASLLEPLLDEAQRCRDEAVVADADLVDAGAVFGTGFAPFTGGPLHYRAQQQGAVQSSQDTKGHE